MKKGNFVMPQPPSGNSIYVTSVPAWVTILSTSIQQGFLGSSTDCLGCDEEGNIVLYREFSERAHNDHKNFKAVWITYDIPSS